MDPPHALVTNVHKGVGRVSGRLLGLMTDQNHHVTLPEIKDFNALRDA
ncbi:hypothetical protein RLO149_c029560 [Roseobacter litoralis Och 149]|uniref:Uncharacterized protein n=1 Tax=Roseobacter litoralis (strain ATCC 49566 / DSM 6996 / JCM 21268 / NBRC 15278 / OCh 149) TaxID=391595 RepID=F7ZH70_ROSLO|nr:hypothetical protein RLO149_c029560 [Roseobacter litoralis Och 149]